MYIDRETRQKLSQLTTELFKRPNLWRKMLEKGYVEPTKETEETLAKYGKAGPTRRGSREIKLLERKHYTVDSLTEWLENLKKEIDEARAKQAAEVAAKNEANQG